ncbi:transcriptional repressor [candidate division KSB1 bacterium]|nr:transcriptional repressor [candidate division KSB1 bacterium]
MANRLMDALGIKGYRVTLERSIITDSLQKVEPHFTAEGLYRFLQKRRSRVSLATIYRTLSALTQMRLIKKFDFGEGTYRYELNITNGNKDTHHHHLVCVKCGKLIDFESDFFPQLNHLAEKLSQEHRFIIIDHELTLFGYCKQCASD